MKTLKIIGICLLSSCGGQAVSGVEEFQRLIPDTAKSWAGRMTNSEYQYTRNIEGKFQLTSLLNGIEGKEMRLWRISGSYDPQVLHILREENGKWQLRELSYYSNKDSIGNDVSKEVQSSFIDILHLPTFWNIPSQSQMVKGDSYGCLDGGNILLEMADKTQYRLTWYCCPDINKEKDSAFQVVNELTQKLMKAQ